MQKPACPRTAKPYKLYTSIVSILLMLGVGQTASQEAQLTPTAEFQSFFSEQLFQLADNSETVDLSNNPQFATIRDLPDFSGKDLRVGLQVGHMDNNNPPKELVWLRGNTGARGGGKWEAEAMKEIVTVAKTILERQGVQVDVLPAIVPPGYEADAFVSVHADGSDSNHDASGYKVAPSEYDRSGRAGKLSDALAQVYGEETQMRWDSNITENMTQYYSFSHHRFQHAIDPDTPGVLLETGFLTNSRDRHYLVDNPDIPGRALAYGVLQYLEEID
jgi:hypothetical protein